MAIRDPSITSVRLPTQTELLHPSSINCDNEVADSVSRETVEILRRYVTLVERWTRSINLVSRSDRGAIWDRHILDSLRLLPLVPKNAERGVDFGSGAGFPGFVVSLATGIPFDLVEADKRKAAFLVEAQRVTGAPVRVHCTRIEELMLPPVPLVTARAFAPLSELLHHASRLLQHDGTALFLKGARVDKEIEEARQNWRMSLRRCDDPQHPGSTILVITDVVRA